MREIYEIENELADALTDYVTGLLELHHLNLALNDLKIELMKAEILAGNTQ